jgi:hypothetical protein
MKAASPYARSVELHRKDKDGAFRYEDWSPIDPRERAHFAGLSYFPPDERWRAQARIERLAELAVLEMATSTGEPRQQVRYARLDFETPAGKASLFAYKDAGGTRRGGRFTDRQLFVPFRDALSGKETYGAGRYLDLEEPEGDEIVVDFNLAYNPYCAYSESFSCPLPPSENWLSIPVAAGERKYEPHDE